MSVQPEQSQGSGVDPRRVQQGLVCMLFDPSYAKAVRARGPLPELSEGERALLREVDPRALATDAMRRARALQVILDEYPTSAAALGVDAVDRFFSSPVFRACVFERGSMVVAFGEFLGSRAKGAGAIEAAVARARRAAADSTVSVSAVPGGAGERLVCARGIVALEVPAGSLAWIEGVRAKLGDEPLRALARRRKPWPKPPPRRGREQLLVEAKADGSVDIGGASASLVGLLRAAEQPLSRAELCAVAVRLGADASEAGELLDDLCGEGLLERRT
ncbi:hypothetical protein G6O69_36605 [Pseudenhygromyxa sp. WMMC2535]|uniref:hypothetical protein n=1 Tax=Pseudenhygromyxa sp. WMMC2535 TaxID=2712867 RepID=UPI00155346AA|nr:hypothetical protein [Pseudenhygromyxa sp. WMMC2535]NVB36205.1 hypothetical protein [Pseudenhygromyxa sp. WMMC2535]NVB43404.1 hypothetical protein [Pseudenhygromyxa sp. WMMC2535]